MGYGLEFTNASNIITLDSEYARLAVICSGRYAPTQESNLGSVTAFPAVITTQEPPLVFVRPDAAGVAALTRCKILGKPGAWTGFYVRTQSVNYAQPNGQYFAAAFKASASADYGLRLFDASGNVIYDNGNPSALFTRAFQNWAFEKTVYDSTTTNYFNYYKTLEAMPPAGEFLLLNTFSMNMVAGNSTGRFVASLWDFPNGLLRAITTSTSNPTAFYMPALFAKKVV
jgi:type 1 fimbria pilin